MLKPSLTWLIDTVLYGLAPRAFAFVFSRLGLRQRSWILGHHLFRPRPCAGRWQVRLLSGERINIADRGSRLRVELACSYDVHEPEVKRAITRLFDVTGRSRMLDIGASMGGMSLDALARGYESLLVEADPEVATELSGLIADLGFHRGTVLNVAIADRAGKLQLHRSRSTYLNSLSREHVPEQQRAGSVSVDATTVDEVLATRGWDPGSLAVIKIDVEGAELAVLEGARRSLESGSVPLVIECFQGPMRESLWNWSAARGYGIVPLRIEGDRWQALASCAEFAAEPGINFLILPRPFVA